MISVLACTGISSSLLKILMYISTKQTWRPKD
jgi:hypothetical protein